MAAPSDLPRGRAPGGALELLGLLLVFAAAYLPGLARPEFDHEEGRRALPARQMLEGGDWIVPRIGGEPYLAKPPGMFWMVAAVSGERPTPASTRLPALAATLGTALLLWRLGRGRPGRPGLLAALLFLAAPLALEKGALGEIEAPFTLLVFAASAATWSARERAGRVVAAGLLFGLAALTKGPAAWVFLGATVAGLARVPGVGLRRALALGAAVLLVSAAVLGAWLALLVGALDAATLRTAWTGEMLGDPLTLPRYLDLRQRYVFGTLGGFLPASALVVAALVHAPARRALLASERARFALVAVAVGLLFFLLFPRSRPRYVLPLLPWVALLGGEVLAGALRADANRFALRSARVLGASVGALGVLAAAAGVVALVVHVPALPLEPWALALLLPLGLAGLLAVRARRPQRSLPLALVVLLLARLVHATGVEPARTGHGWVEAAAALDAELPDGASLATDVWDEFNLQAHLAHPVAYVADAGSLASGAYLLHPCPPRPADCSQASCVGRAPAAWTEVLRRPCGKHPGHDLVLWVRGPASHVAR